MLVLHGAAHARDARRLEAALAPFQRMAAALLRGAALKIAPAGSLVLIATEAADGAPDAFVTALRDVETAQRLALAHSQLLNTLAREIDVLPARLSGPAESEAALVAQARAQEQRLLSRLTRIGGALEYALRIAEAPATRPDDAAASAKPDGASTSPGGRAYLRRKLDKRRAKEARSAARDAFLEGLTAAAESLSRETRATSGATERRPDLVLDLALLAPRAREPDVVRLAETAQPRAEALGLRFDAIGPWAPFSFATDPEEEEEAAAAAFRRAADREQAS